MEDGTDAARCFAARPAPHGWASEWPRVGPKGGGHAPTIHRELRARREQGTPSERRITQSGPTRDAAGAEGGPPTVVAETGRRDVIRTGGGLMLGAIGASAGSIRGLVRAADAGPGSAAAATARSLAGFGWEVTDLHDNGADVYFDVLRDLRLDFVEVDVSYMVTSPPSQPGFAEVLYTGGVVPKAAFSSGPQAYVTSPLSSDFGAVRAYNPNHLNVVMDGALYQGDFLRLILKSWVPSDGTASQAYRHVRTEPAVVLPRGAVLVFHMDHAGVPVDSEMQVVLGYTPA